MAKDESATRGTMVLATVKGDVHDIGKNLVEIILKNNGYRIINLGIKVPPEDLIAAYHPTSRTRSASPGSSSSPPSRWSMTAQDLRAAGIEIPLFVGGAALTRKFTATRIAAGVSGADALRQGRDGRARHRQSALQRDHARRAARAGAGRAGGAPRRRRCRAGTGAGPGRGGRRAVVGLARRRRARAAGPRPARAAQRAAEPPLPVPESADAPRQAPRREGRRSGGCSSEGDDKAREIMRGVEELKREAAASRA